MTRVVLHSSVIDTWVECGRRERTTLAGILLAARQGIVPSVWPLQVEARLMEAEHRRESGRSMAVAFLTFVDSLPIHVDEGATRRAVEGIMDQLRGCDISEQDAMYLELALRLRAPIAIADRSFGAVAEALGARVVGM